MKNLALTAILVLPWFFSLAVAQEANEQYLDPELEMEIIRYLNKEDRQWECTCKNMGHIYGNDCRRWQIRAMKNLGIVPTQEN